MSKDLMRRAETVWPITSYTPSYITVHLRRGWVRSVTMLGDRWVLAKKQPKLAEPIA
jgi:hypothetical protein